MGRPWDKQMRADAAPSCWRMMIARLSFACATITPLARRGGLSRHQRFGWLHQNVLSWYHLWSPLYSETWLNYQNAMENHWQLLFPTVSIPMDFHLAEAELARALLQIIASKNLAKALRVLRKIIWYGPPKHWLCAPAMNVFDATKGCKKGGRIQDDPWRSMVIHGTGSHSMLFTFETVRQVEEIVLQCHRIMLLILLRMFL